MYIYANSRDVLESAKGLERRDGAGHDPCTAIAGGCGAAGPTRTAQTRSIFLARMSARRHPSPYCCIPILAHGETIGLLYLKFRVPEALTGAQPEEDAEIAAQRRLGIICTEHISLAIANVKLRDQLRDESIRDPLTGLFNRRYLLETCRREFARAVRTGQQIVCCPSTSITSAKRFNDIGHDAGDAVLRAVGGCLGRHFAAMTSPAGSAARNSSRSCRARTSMRQPTGPSTCVGSSRR